MADSEYDVVIVGCGNKSSIAAMYLTKYAKMSVGMFEERHEICAGWCSEENIAPGWMADPCSSMMVHWPMYWGPLMDDFPELADYGVQFITFPVAFTVIRPDNKALNIFNEKDDPDGRKTAASVAKFSKKDADMYLRLWNKWKTKWQGAFYEFLFNPPQPPDKDPIMRLMMDPEGGLNGPLDPQWLFRYSPVQLARELFPETPEFWHIFFRVMDTTGASGMESGAGFMSLMALFTWTYHAVVQGGTHQLAHAVQRVITENGGEIFQKSPVKKILIEDGVAKGIRLKDGTEVKAKVAVLSGVDIMQLMFELVGKEHFDPLDVTRVNNLSVDYNSLYWYNYGWKEEPKFLAEDLDPDIKDSGYVEINQEMPSLEEITRHQALRTGGGAIPKENLFVVVTNRAKFDPTRVPSPEYCTGLVDVFSKQGIWSRREFMKFFNQLVVDVHDIISRFAPNITRDKLIGYGLGGPTALASLSRSYYRGNWKAIDCNIWQSGPCRPTPNLASGRMPVKGLYATGMCFHPSWGADVWPGYDVYKIMTEDIDLPRPWVDKGRIPERVEDAYKHIDRFEAKHQV